MGASNVAKSGSGASFTQSTAIPITTIFTPPNDCTAASAYASTSWANNQFAYQLDSGIRKPSCYPPSYSAYQYQSGLWYSPAVCPLSYEYVATSIQQTSSEPATTLAICCPPGVYTAPGEGWSCYEVITTGNAILSFSNTLSLPSTTVYANPISVAWQEGDLSLFTPASAPVLALAAAGITFVSTRTTSQSLSVTSLSTSSLPLISSSVLTSTSASTSTSMSTSTSTSKSSLSTGAAAGIGVGATVIVLTVLVGIWWLLRNYKLSRRSPGNQEQREDDGIKPHPLAKTPNTPSLGTEMISEMPDTAFPYEADEGASRIELEAQWTVRKAANGKYSPI